MRLAQTKCDNLKVKVEAVLQDEALGEAAVLLHVVGQGVVPVGSLSLRQKDRVVEADELVAYRRWLVMLIR